jgi:hypothetical protein
MIAVSVYICNTQFLSWYWVVTCTHDPDVPSTIDGLSLQVKVLAWNLTSFWCALYQFTQRSFLRLLVGGTPHHFVIYSPKPKNWTLWGRCTLNRAESFFFLFDTATTPVLVHSRTTLPAFSLRHTTLSLPLWSSLAEWVTLLHSNRKLAGSYFAALLVLTIFSPPLARLSLIATTLANCYIAASTYRIGDVVFNRASFVRPLSCLPASSNRREQGDKSTFTWGADNMAPRSLIVATRDRKCRKEWRRLHELT